MACRQNVGITNTLQLRDFATATAFGTTLVMKWPLMGDNDIQISYNGWLVFSQPYVFWAFFRVS